MEPQKHIVKDGRVLLIREATVADAGPILDYFHDISAETGFLSFGPGELETSQVQEAEFIRGCLAAANQLFLVGTIEDTIVALLYFVGGRRPRLQHAGELAIAVREAEWGLGIGSILLDVVIDWAHRTPIVKKINLRVRTDNRRAIRLYESRDFVIEGTIRKDILIDGIFYDSHWMGLEL